MLLFWTCLALCLSTIPFTLSATVAPQDIQLNQVTLPSNIAAGPSNGSVEVRMANETPVEGKEIACFVQKKKHEERLYWIRFIDCYSTMARGVLLGNNVMERNVFTKYDRPFSWNGGSCMIIIDQKGSVAPGIQKAEIAHWAAIVTRFCVKLNVEGKPLGGQIVMGEGDAYTLTIYGREFPVS